MEIDLGKLYEISSGMGGTFTVQALSVDPDDGGRIACRVYMPKNPDWHRYLVHALPADMKASNEVMPPRAWSGRTARQRVGGSIGT